MKSRKDSLYRRIALTPRHMRPWFRPKLGKLKPLTEQTLLDALVAMSDRFVSDNPKRMVFSRPMNPNSWQP